MEVHLNFDENEALYYYYHNWRAGQNNKIHQGFCARCKYGSGTAMQNVQRGNNGVWLGPFSTIELCQQFINRNLGIDEAEVHNCPIPEN